MEQLLQIYNYLKKGTRDTRNIEVILNEPNASEVRGISLTLDMKEGFSGYETVKIAESITGLSVEYSSLIYNAFDTFLTKDSLQKDIEKSEVLSKFKREIEKIKDEGKFEIAEKNQQLYTQFAKLKEEADKKESYNVIDFFIGRFKDKVSNPSGYTWRLLA